jgi:S-DNA-T family DNA segregation ATPase FtsK/SpoIIIE
VSKITSLADDLALALAAARIRIQAPVPGKGYIGIEVPNRQVALVSLREVLFSSAYENLDSPLKMALGKDVAGKAVAADLTAMPHLLIAGTTGAGKSVCINDILACFLLNMTPDDLRLILVDPKRVELTGYNGIPHLLSPVIVDAEHVVGALQWMMREMDSRYRKFSETGTRNIADFNALCEKTAQKKLPYLVVVIDELADLMMLAPDETERTITRLAQLARATGIHLIIATQRPSTDIFTGLIKANFPARIAFAVASSVDSRVILDQPGAERLLGRGDMLFQAPDAAAPVRIQTAFISDLEINRWQLTGAVSPSLTAHPNGLINRQLSKLK